MTSTCALGTFEKLGRPCSVNMTNDSKKGTAYLPRTTDR